MPFDHDESTALQLRFDESDFEPSYDTTFDDDKVVNFLQLDDDDTLLEDVDDSYKTAEFTGISDYNVKSFDTTSGDEGVI